MVPAILIQVLSHRYNSPKATIMPPFSSRPNDSIKKERHFSTFSALACIVLALEGASRRLAPSSTAMMAMPEKNSVR